MAKTDGKRRLRPYKTLWWLEVVSFVPLFLGMVMYLREAREGAVKILFLPLPVLLALMGIVLALNVNGNTATLRSMHQLNHWSIDRLRLAGAGVAVFGVVLAVLVGMNKA